MKRIILLLGILALSIGAATAQNSLPAPGSGSITPPAGGYGGGYGPGPVAPPPPPAWGSPWDYGWNGYYGYNPYTTVYVSPTYQDNGKVNVVGVGYDDEGVWRTVPMSVEYNYNGKRYSATVLTAWDPWTDSWNTNLDVPAINTSYTLNGQSYEFYVVLSTGTYYFNL